MPRGGARPGAGKKKGTKHKNTIEREVARKHYEQRILAELDPLINAQFDVAKGLFLMFAREWETKNRKRARTGKFVRVDSPLEIKSLLNGDGKNGKDYYYISAKDPDGRVLENLMSRVFGKAKETIEHEVGEETKTALAKLSQILP